VVIDLDCKETIVGDLSFGNFPVGISDSERGFEAMGFDAMLPYEHPMDECCGCSTVDHSSGLQ
jgi:hypothetical protein